MRKKLATCNPSVQSASFLSIERGYLNMAAAAQWLANGGADVALDGISVTDKD